MKRRDFLKLASTIGSASLVSADAFAYLFPISFTPPQGLSILQGYTTDSATQLAVCVSRFAKVVYGLEDIDSGKKIDPASVKEVTHDVHLTRVDKIRFTGLQLGHTYKLTVFSLSSNSNLDTRYLKTVDLNKADFKIGLMSCMNDYLVSESTKNEIWNSAYRSDLDYLFFIGDSVYGDFPMINGPGILWRRYVDARSSIPFYRWQNLKPVIAIWDDHDFGKNDGNGDYRHKQNSLHQFKTFFAQESDGRNLLKGPAASVFLRAFGQNFAFLDNRYFRGSRPSQRENSFFGKQQIDWASGIIEKSPAPTLILNGSPIFGRLKKQSSYEFQAPEELHYFLGRMRSAGSPVMFGGGDLHYSEVSEVASNRIGYKTYELISSCMHSSMKTKPYDNSNAHRQGYMHENFIVVGKNGSNADPAWKVSCHNRTGKQIFSIDCSIA